MIIIIISVFVKRHEVVISEVLKKSMATGEMFTVRRRMTAFLVRYIDSLWIKDVELALNS